MHNHCHEGLVSGDLGIPSLYKLAQDDGKEGVELKVKVVAASQRRQQLLDGGSSITALLPALLGAQGAADELHGRSIRESIDLRRPDALARWRRVRLGARGDRLLVTRPSRDRDGGRSHGGGGHGRQLFGQAELCVDQGPIAQSCELADMCGRRSASCLSTRARKMDQVVCQVDVDVRLGLGLGYSGLEKVPVDLFIALHRPCQVRKSKLALTQAPGFRGNPYRIMGFKILTSLLFYASI
jgi:hypothetical protein